MQTISGPQSGAQAKQGEGKGRRLKMSLYPLLDSAGRDTANAVTDLNLSKPQAGTLLPRPKWTFQTGQPADPGGGYPL